MRIVRWASAARDHLPCDVVTGAFVAEEVNGLWQHLMEKNNWNAGWNLSMDHWRFIAGKSIELNGGSSIATFCQRNRKNRRNRPFPFVTRLIAHPAVTLQHFPHVFSVKSAWVALGPWRRAHQGWFISGWDMCVIWTSCHGMVSQECPGPPQVVPPSRLRVIPESVKPLWGYFPWVFPLPSPSSDTWYSVPIV